MAAPLIALLDVNILVALHDSEHVHHSLVLDWFETNVAAAWASFPLTQNGCLRVMSEPQYPNARSFGVLSGALAATFKSPQHAFWNDDISLLDERRFRHDRNHGHRQLTDLYLLALAVRHKARLVTLDGGIAASAVVGASAHHLVTLTA